MRRTEPTVVNIKPRLAKAWLTSDDFEKRREYSRVQLLLNKPFTDRGAYDSFMTEFDGDFIAAYAHFAKTDFDVPNCVRDDTVCRLMVDVDIWPLNELNMLSEAKPGFPRHPRVTHNDIIHKSDAKNIF